MIIFSHIKLSKPKLSLASVLIYKTFSNPAESKCFFFLYALTISVLLYILAILCNKSNI